MARAGTPPDRGRCNFDKYRGTPASSTLAPKPGALQGWSGAPITPRADAHSPVTAPMTPVGTRVARSYCPESHTTFSLLPDCLAARLPGTLKELEAVVAVAEQMPSLIKAADKLRRASRCAFLCPIPLTLTSDGDGLALAVTVRTDPADHTSMSLDDCITGALAGAAAALSPSLNCVPSAASATPPFTAVSPPSAAREFSSSRLRHRLMRKPRAAATSFTYRLARLSSTLCLVDKMTISACCR